MVVFKEKPIFGICLRRFEKPGNNIEENLRKFCISIGLLQPGDSRDIIIDILKILLNKKKKREYTNIEEINQLINKKGKTLPNIRRQVRRLIDIGIAEKTNNGYRIKEFMNLKELIDEILEYRIKPTIERIKEYGEEIDSQFIE